MKTLFVKFDNSYSCKEYQFLTDDMRIEVGDRIVSPDYNNPMTVVRVLNRCNKYNSKGTPNKVLNICCLNGKPYTCKAYPSTPAEARAWFKYGGEFRERALERYSLGELVPWIKTLKDENIEEILVGMNRISKKILSTEALIRAMEIKEDKDKTPIGNYAIVKLTDPDMVAKVECVLDKGFCVVRHQGIKYPGLIYFKSVRNAARVYYDAPDLFEQLTQLTNWES